jgi:hypothetical protein
MDRVTAGGKFIDWRWLAWMAVGLFILALLSAKAIYQHRWFPGPALELFGQPALVFFTLERSCPCQMAVVNSAESQLAGWEATARLGIKIVPVDFSRRADLARKYGVARAPALVLLDHTGQVVWKQDVGLSDEKPLDLIQAQNQVEALVLVGGY